VAGRLGQIRALPALPEKKFRCTASSRSGSEAFPHASRLKAQNDEPDLTADAPSNGSKKRNLVKLDLPFFQYPSTAKDAQFQNSLMPIKSEIT